MTIENDSELQSKTIDWLRFPLSIAVIFIHVSVPRMRPVDYSHFSSIDIYNIVYASVAHVLTYIAVPCFFMFSGFLFFYKLKEWNKNIYQNKIKSRFKTLVIPYLLWNLIAVFVWAIKFAIMDGSIWIYFQDLYDKGLWRIFWNSSVWGGSQTNILGQVVFHNGPALLPLWFLRDLILTVFLSPFVYYLVKYAKIYGIVLLGMLYYTQVGVVVGYNIDQLITALFYFSLGSYFSIFGKNMVVLLRKGQVYWFLIAITSLMLSTYYDGNDMQKYFFPLYVISGVISAVNITSFFMERGKLKVHNTLSKASFFIYATHTILILGIVSRLVNRIYPSDNAIILLAKYLIIPFVCSAICLSIYLLMRKLFPNILNLLTGNR